MTGVLARALLLAGVVMALPGCYAGVAAIVAAVAGSSGGSSGKSSSLPAAIFTAAPERIDGDRVAVQCSLSDEDSDRLDAVLEWAPAETSEFRLATLVQGEVTSPLGTWVGQAPVGRPPGAATFIWSARDDLRHELDVSVKQVRLRLSVKESLDASRSSKEPSTSATFWAGNTPPALVAVRPAGERTGPLPFEVELSESSPDDGDIRGEFRVGSGSFEPMTLMGSSEFRAAENRPVKVTVVWNSRADFAGRVSRDVWVRIIANDRLDSDSKVVFDMDQPITVDNNTSPSIAIELAPTDRSFEIPIFYTVRDPEEDPVTAIFQWALDGEPFPELEISEIPSGEERAALEDLLLSDTPEATARRRHLHICTPARFEARGTLDSGTNHLPGDRIRETALVSLGLGHAPPSRQGPRNDLDAFPGASSRLAAVGKSIDFEDPGTGEVWRRVIRELDPRGCEARLDAPLPRPLSPGVIYRLQLGGPALHRASSREGALHTFAWSSLDDLSAAARGRQISVNVRAVVLDVKKSETPSNVMTYRISNEPLLQAESLPTAGLPAGIATGDWNGDGRADLVVAGSATGMASLYVQDSAGRLVASEPPLDTGSPQSAVAMHDVNCDGLDDILLAHGGEPIERVSVFLQEEASSPGLTVRDLALHGEGDPVALLSGKESLDGPGPFVAVALEASPAVALFHGGTDCRLPVEAREKGILEEDPVALAINDRGDVLLVSTRSALRVHRRSGSDPFSLESPLSLQVPGPSSGLALGDHDGDGVEDILAAVPALDQVSFYPGRDGGFAEVPDETAVLMPGRSPASLGTADVDGDGEPDVLVPCAGSNRLAVHLHRGRSAPAGRDLRYASAPDVEIETGPEPSVIAIDDLNGDGLPDAAVTHRGNDTVGVYLQAPAGSISFERFLALGAPTRPASLAAADVNGDGRTDLAISSSGVRTIRVHLQTVSGGLSGEHAAEARTEGDPGALFTGDWNSDGLVDLGVTTDRGVELLVQDRKGGLIPPVEVIRSTGESPAAAAGDFDQDGALDIVVGATTSRGSSISIHLQRDGAISSRAILEMPSGSYAAALAVGDLDSDGRDDLIVSDPLESTVTLRRGNGGGAGGFEDPVFFEVAGGSFPRAVCAGDLSGDGRDDVVVATSLPDEVRIHIQDGAGALDSSPTFVRRVADEPVSLAMGDLGGSPVHELVVASADEDRVQVLRAGESGSFAAGPIFALPTRRFPNSVALADFNGDSRNDLAVLSRDGREQILVYLAR